MASQEELRAEYRALAADADAARRRYDDILIAPDVDADELEIAALEAKEAERARLAAAKRLHTARVRGSASSSEANMTMTASFLTLDVGAAPRVPNRTDHKGGSVSPLRSGQRDEVADVLSLYGAPARTQGLIAGVRELHGGDMTTAKMAQLRREEVRQYRRAHEKTAVPRPWYIVPCISADTLIAAPGTFSLSTWPITDRIITPHAPRLWVAQTVINLATLLSSGQARPGRDGIEVLLRSLLRGTNWGRGGARGQEVSGGKPRTVDQLSTIIEDADADATTLHNLHRPVAQDARNRLEELAGRSGQDVFFWGVPRVRSVAVEESGS